MSKRSLVILVIALLLVYYITESLLLTLCIPSIVLVINMLHKQNKANDDMIYNTPSYNSPDESEEFELTPPPSEKYPQENTMAIKGNKRSKKYDTTPLTQAHYAVIMEEYNNMVINNADKANEHIYAKDVAETINARLGLNKSRQSYANVWLGHIKFEDLQPAG